VPIRIKPGVPSNGVANELTTISSQFFRTQAFAMTVSVIPLRDKMTVGARPTLWLLFGCVGAVMLIVCFNLGNLMLVRATGRMREAGVRMALGASRGHLFRLTLTEALLLMLFGAAAGLILAQFALKAFASAAPVDLPRMDELTIDWRVLAFAACSALFCTLLCGLIPAWRLSRIDPQESLKTSSPNSTGTRGMFRLRELLVSVEVATSTVLLIAGGLLSFSFWRVMRADRGFETTHVITQDISFLNPKYAAGGRNRFVPEILDRLRAIPGVRAAGVTNQLPLRGEDWTSLLADFDQPPANTGIGRLANFRFVTPEYWTAMGIPLKQGRFFRESERDSKVAILSERAAEYLWPGKNPLGRHVRSSSSRFGGSLEVVGVVGEIWTRQVEENPPMMVYEPYNLVSPIVVSIVLRTQSDPVAVISAMRSMLRAADPDMALGQTKTMEQIVEESVATRKFETSLVAAFAVAALAIASLGIYGVIAFTVSRRRAELGIRIALGAGSARLMTLVMAQGLAPVILGLVLGCSAALLLGRLLASQLYGVTPNDPRIYFGIASVLFLSGACACWIPARRAAKVDPLLALRCD
jgi:putative ABC transport system permease protein